MASQLISSMDRPFEPEKYTNEYQGRLREAIARKKAEEELVSPEPEPTGKIISLMDALQASLEKQQKEGDAKKPAARSRRKTAGV